MEINFNTYQDLINSYQITNEVINEKEYAVIENEEGEVINIDPYSSTLPVYILTKKYTTLKDLVITGEVDSKEIDNLNALAEYGVKCNLNADEDLASNQEIKFMVILQDYTTPDNFISDITKYCDLYRNGNFAYPHTLYVESISTLEEYQKVLAEVTTITNHTTNLVYYNKYQEDTQQEEEENKTLQTQLFDKVVIELSQNVSEVEVLISQKDKAQLVYERMEALRKYIKEQAELKGTKVISLNLPTGSFSRYVLGVLASVYLEDEGYQFICNSSLRTMLLHMISDFYAMRWNFLEHRFKSSFKSGIKVFTQYSQPYLCYIKSFNPNLEFKWINYTDFENYLEKGCDEDFYITTNEQKFNTSKLKFVPIAQALAFSDLQITSPEQTNDILTKTYKIEEEVFLPLIKLFERLFTDFKNIYTIRDLAVLGDINDKRTWRIGVGKINPTVDIIRFVLNEEYIQDTFDHLEGISIRNIHDYDIIDEDLASTPLFKQFAKVFATVANKKDIPEDKLLQLCKLSLNKSVRKEDAFIKYNLLHIIFSQPEEVVSFPNTYPIYTNLARGINWTHYEFVKDSLLKYCSLYGIRSCPYDKMLVNVYGNLMLTEQSKQGYLSAVIKMSDMVRRLFTPVEED